LNTYLALGDSYTIGTGVLKGERWPVLLVGALKSMGYALDDPEIIAQNGWTTDELIAGIESANLSSAYELVSLQIGVNNQYRGRALENFQLEFADLLIKAIKLADHRASNVIVVSIPDWGVTPFADGRYSAKIAEEIDQFNRVKKYLAQSSGASYVDITALSRQTGRDPAMLADDSLHPSGLMYAAWVDRILPVAVRILDGAK
jgi:lysophospholipase L1-like esterase